MTRSLLVVSSLSLVVILMSACGTGVEGQPSSSDPRCSALCTIDEPSIEGAFDICSAGSASSCVDLCEAHIANVSSLCASCLLENAHFSGGGSIRGSECINDLCTITGVGGSCTYDTTNIAAEEDCFRKVSPRKTVDCSVSFQSVSKCTGICS